MVLPPTVANFFRAFRGHWLGAMSGAFSVPFAGIAAFTEGFAQAIFLVLAAAAAGVAGYRVWSFERERVCELEETLRPKLKCSFDSNDPGCVRPNTTLTQTTIPIMGKQPVQVQTVVTYYRVKVETDGAAHVANARGRLNSIIRDGRPIVIGEPIVFGFVSPTAEEGINKDIRGGIPEYLDFILITDDNRVFALAYNMHFSSSLGDPNSWFAGPGEYLLDISILSSAPTKQITMKLNWTGDLSTSTVSAA